MALVIVGLLLGLVVLVWAIGHRPGFRRSTRSIDPSEFDRQ